MNTFNHRTVILADGDFPAHPIALSALRTAKHLVCCDNAATALLSHGMTPTTIVGDLDSFPSHLRDRFSNCVVRFNEQQTNDLAKAFRYCLLKGWRDIVVLGATGRREDHALGNLSLLADFVSEAPEAVFITDNGVFHGLTAPGGNVPTFPRQQISLFSFDPSESISAEGLVYPVQSLPLRRWWQGTLNEATGDQVSFSFEGSPLLVYTAHANAGAKHREAPFDDAPIPAALTIAGSDSGGNAGIEADLRAFHALRVHGCVAICAVTAQNPDGVRNVQVMDAKMIQDQLDAIFEVYPVAALKTGMLATETIIRAIAERLSAQKQVAKVLDPVMIATSGAPLIDENAIGALKEVLLPQATLITPNLPETAALLEHEVTDPVAAAHELADKIGCAALVKGGHSLEKPAEDILVIGNDCYRLTTPVIENPKSTHGTGCTLSSAIAGSLARGLSLLDAVVLGKSLVYEAIRTGRVIGPRSTVMGMPEYLPAEIVEVTRL